MWSCLRFDRFGEPSEVLHQSMVEPRPVRKGWLRIKMIANPVNPSDLIPISGAYQGRVQPCRIAGYEGIGIVAEAWDSRWVGRRILPLRADGTWQTFVDCSPAWTVPVPDRIPNHLAARAYINPLAARLIVTSLGRPHRLVLTGASSDCSFLIAQMALKRGTAEVFGVIRSERHEERLRRAGIVPMAQDDHEGLRRVARSADVIADCVGGALAGSLQSLAPPDAAFLSFGLLSGEQPKFNRHGAPLQFFHLRHAIASMTCAEWQRHFRHLWAELERAELQSVTSFAFGKWRAALAHASASPRSGKALLEH